MMSASQTFCFVECASQAPLKTVSGFGFIAHPAVSLRQRGGLPVSSGGAWRRLGRNSRINWGGEYVLRQDATRFFVQSVTRFS